MIKKKSVIKLKKDADKWFSHYIRLRDSQNGIAECITCGMRKPIKEMQAGHFVSRRFNILRFDEQNVNAQCLGCNMFRSGEQYLYAKALDLKYGIGTAEELMGRRYTTKKLTIPELETIIQSSKNYIKDMA